MNSETTVRHGFRPEIQGLRAVAVLLVIAYHVYPNRVTGGYVGVDVFFVLSGFLITSHLYREASSTEHLSLTRFWARRIRRLLPASLLVLAVCAVATALWVPRSMWDQTLRQIGASALYVENWALAADAVDYSAIGNEPTLVQHYWSLSVEEQFYLVWPLLVVAALLLVRRTRLPLRPTLAVGFGTVVLASFVYSVTATSADSARAYFVTPTRAWEFGLGALIGLAGASTESWWRGREPVRVLVGWAGLAAVLWAGLSLSDATAFPGWIAAVPVLGTVAVIAAGSAASPIAVARPLSWRPATFLGDISYSMYLWHWPFIVVLPFITGVELRTTDKVAIFAATLLVSWACTRFVEDPMRTARFLTVTWRPYALGAAGMVVVVAAVGVLRADLDHDVEQAQQATDKIVQQALLGDAPCIGPAALEPARRDECGPVAGRDEPILEPAAVVEQNKELAFPGCMSMGPVEAVHTCDLGTTKTPARTVAVVGDSHATHWFRAFDELGKQRDWRVRTYTRSGCPFTGAQAARGGDWAESRYPLCWNSNDTVVRRLVADPDVDTVFVSADSASYTWEQRPGTDFADPATDGFRAMWQQLTDAGKQVVVIRDVPEVKDRAMAPNCVAEHPSDPDACANPRRDALVPDVQADAVSGAPDGVKLIDLTDQFCDDRLCYVVIGDVIVYRDIGHLSDEYSTLLGPYVGRAFDEVDDRRG